MKKGRGRILLIPVVILCIAITITLTDLFYCYYTGIGLNLSSAIIDLNEPQVGANISLQISSTFSYSVQSYLQNRVVVSRAVCDLSLVLREQEFSVHFTSNVDSTSFQKNGECKTDVSTLVSFADVNVLKKLFQEQDFRGEGYCDVTAFVVLFGILPVGSTFSTRFPLVEKSIYNLESTLNATATIGAADSKYQFEVEEKQLSLGYSFPIPPSIKSNMLSTGLRSLIVKVPKLDYLIMSPNISGVYSWRIWTEESNLNLLKDDIFTPLLNLECVSDDNVSCSILKPIQPFFTSLMPFHQLVARSDRNDILTNLIGKDHYIEKKMAVQTSESSTTSHRKLSSSSSGIQYFDIDGSYTGFVSLDFSDALIGIDDNAGSHIANASFAAVFEPSSCSYIFNLNGFYSSFGEGKAIFNYSAIERNVIISAQVSDQNEQIAFHSDCQLKFQSIADFSLDPCNAYYSKNKIFQLSSQVQTSNTESVDNITVGFTSDWIGLETVSSVLRQPTDLKVDSFFNISFFALNRHLTGIFLGAINENEVALSLSMLKINSYQKLRLSSHPIWNMTVNWESSANSDGTSQNGITKFKAEISSIGAVMGVYSHASNRFSFTVADNFVDESKYILPLIDNTDKSGIVWQGGGGLSYRDNAGVIQINGDAEHCYGGRGFETLRPIYNGDFSVSATFLFDNICTDPGISIFPVQNNWNWGMCAGRIALQLNCGQLSLYGEENQSVSGGSVSAGPNQVYTLVLSHRPSEGVTYGSLYDAADLSTPLSTISISETFHGNLNAGFNADQDDTSTWASFLSFAVGDQYFFQGQLPQVLNSRHSTANHIHLSDLQQKFQNTNTNSNSNLMLTNVRTNTHKNFHSNLKSVFSPVASIQSIVSSQRPTSAPTRAPVATPTMIPTAVPTRAPVAAPTMIPTAIPISIPTIWPSSTPSALTLTPTVLTPIPTPVPTIPATKTSENKKTSENNFFLHFSGIFDYISLDIWYFSVDKFKIGDTELSSYLTASDILIESCGNVTQGGVGSWLLHPLPESLPKSLISNAFEYLGMDNLFHSIVDSHTSISFWWESFALTETGQINGGFFLEQQNIYNETGLRLEAAVSSLIFLDAAKIISGPSDNNNVHLSFALKESYENEDDFLTYLHIKSTDSILRPDYVLGDLEIKRKPILTFESTNISSDISSVLHIISHLSSDNNNDALKGTVSNNSIALFTFIASLGNTATHLKQCPALGTTLGH